MALYERFIDTMVPVSSAEAAEMTKILENTFRAVNIGLVNETAIIADRLGVDVWEVIDAAATKPFGFMKFTPGPGLGGHCIPVDPHYLSWKMRTLNYKTRFIELASEINAEMPLFVVGKVREALNSIRKAVNGSRVLLLGVAYKKDIDDLRESPALDIIGLLQADGADVAYHDPYVPFIHADEDGHPEMASVELTDEALSGARRRGDPHRPLQLRLRANRREVAGPRGRAQRHTEREGRRGDARNAPVGRQEGLTAPLERRPHPAAPGDGGTPGRHGSG